MHAGSEHAQAAALRAAGLDVRVHSDEPDLAGLTPAERGAALRVLAGGTAVPLDGTGAVPDVGAARGLVWLVAPDGDPGLASALTGAGAGAVEVEVQYGSWDPPGARLLDAVAVMDRLRSPGGCPWDAQQTHTSLMPYLLEEAYEAHDALAADDTDALREELGDVLLQVLFHARLAEEAPADERWSVDDVAGGLVDKLVRRHPHVFAGPAEVGAGVRSAEELHASWDAIKRAEKQRTSAVDGVPLGQPALALTGKLIGRASRAGVRAVPPGPAVPVDDDAVATEEALGATLFALVAAARGRGLDAEAALRRAAVQYAERIRAAESAATPSA